MSFDARILENQVTSIADDAPRRAVLCSVQLPDVTDQAFDESLNELRRLANTLGLVVATQIAQKRSSFDSSAYIGPGKLSELAAAISSSSEPTVVLLDHE